MKPDSEFFSPKELSDRWANSISKGTLANWRTKKMGPSYHKLGGKIVYKVLDVEKWEETNIHLLK